MKQSPLTENKNRGTATYDVGITGPDLEQAQKCGRVKWINEIQIPSW